LGRSLFRVYEAPDGRARVEVRLDRETVWLTQRQMADLFTTSADNIGLHLKNVFLDKELDEGTTTEDFSVVQLEGKRNVHREVKHYNLDAIISVGYRSPTSNTSGSTGITVQSWLDSIRPVMDWPRGRKDTGWPERSSSI
jgi:hypothetical protein